jgi:ABC-type uncharacterized transport system auxiliary subunit
MNKTILIILLVFACGKAPLMRFYNLHYEKQKTDDQTLGDLYIEHFKGNSVYQQDHMIYRETPYEYKFDPYRRWIAEPTELLTRQAIDHFRQSGLFNQVTRQPLGTDSYYLLESEIKAFEEIIKGDKRYAKISLWIRLSSWDQTFNWAGVVSKDVPITQTGAAGIVAAMSKATQLVFEQIEARFTAL